MSTNNTNTKRITIDIPAELLAAIDAQAKSEGFARNEYIRLTLAVDIESIQGATDDFDDREKRKQMAEVFRSQSPRRETSVENGKRGTEYGGLPPKPGSKPRGRPKKQTIAE